MNKSIQKINQNTVLRIEAKLKALEEAHIKEFGNTATIYFWPWLMEDLNFKQAVSTAKLVWLAQVNKYVEENNWIRDGINYCPGSCVLGAGIDILALRSMRHKHPEYIKILNAPDHYQSSLTWEHSLALIVELFKDRGFDVSYKCGRMD